MNPAVERHLFGVPPSCGPDRLKPGHRTLGSWRASTLSLARIGTMNMNRGGFVAQAFEPAGSGDFPVARSWSTGLESPVNPQAGKPALQAGSWKARTGPAGPVLSWFPKTVVASDRFPAFYL